MRFISRQIAAVLFVSVFFSPLALAKDGDSDVAKSQSLGSSLNAITPVFGQLVMLSYPKGFKFAYQNGNESQYIQESVLAGESVDKWSQMITLTGSKGLTANAKVTPRSFAHQMGEGFMRACPTSFTGQDIGALEIDGHEAFLFFAGCGSVQVGVPRSESALFAVIKGLEDYYTLQWAERGEPIEQAPALDIDKWSTRFQALYPIRLCARIPGEPEPYPSCVQRKQ